MVFLALNVWAFADSAPQGVSGWVFAGIGTIMVAAVMVAVGALVRLRVWVWMSVVGLVFGTAFFGWASGNWWGATIGNLAAGFVAVGAHELLDRLSPRFESPLRADHTAMTVLQFLATAAVALVAPFLPLTGNGGVEWIGVAGLFLGLAVLAALGSRIVGTASAWSFLTGMFAVATIAVLPLAFGAQPSDWNVALAPATAALALVGVAAVRRTWTVRRPLLLAGALTVGLTAATPAVLITLLRGASLAFAPLVGEIDSGQFYSTATIGIAASLGLAATAAGIWGVSRLTLAPFARAMAVLARWFGGLALLGAAVWPGLTLEAHVALELGLALVVSLAVRLVPQVRSSSLVLRVPLIGTAFAALLLGIGLSWTDAQLAVFAGVGGLVVLAAIAQILPQGARPILMGVGFAYALVIVGTALDQFTTLETLAIFCITSAFGSVVALVSTLTSWLRSGTWYAVLAVTTIPAVIAVGVLFVEISGWTAVSTGAFFLLILALVITRRSGLTGFLRVASAALLVPSLSVVVLAVAAQFLQVSASPIALPIIAVIVAVTLPTAGLVASALERRGLSAPHAAAVRWSLELSALATGAIAVILAFVRPAAGPDTALLIFVLIGIGAISTAIWARRRYAWIVAGVAWTGALWTALSIAGVQVAVIEPYALPPALVAALVGAILVARGRTAAVGLYVAGLASAVVPSLVVLALVGSGADAVVPWRAIGLLGGSFVLFIAASLIRGRAGRPANRFAPLLLPTLLLAIATAAAGVIQGVRYARGADAVPGFVDTERPMPWVLLFAAAAVLLAAGAGRVATAGRVPPEDALELPVSERWWYAPAAAYLVIGPMFAIRPHPFEIWTLWALMTLLLAVLVATTALSRSRAVSLPPTWYLFALAWVTGVVGWSQREILRVEGWSLVMGAALLVAGIVAIPQLDRPIAPTLTNWPIGRRKSWWLLGPGLVVIFLPSIIATFTDPATWRAILVVALALVSVLVGAIIKLKAPFVIGLVVLGVENVVVLLVQFNSGIESVPWWITLATAGAVLFAIAIRFERRTGREASTGARMRDLERWARWGSNPRPAD